MSIFTTMKSTHSTQSWFKMTVLATAIGALGLTACTTTTAPSKSRTTTQQPAKQPAVAKVDTGYLDSDSLNQLEDLLYATDMRAVEGDRLLILKHGDVWKRIPVGFRMNVDSVYNSRVTAQRSWFASRQPYLDRLSARASRYLYHTVREAERRGLPTELALLPIIESSYDPAATSSAAAAGLWQFIPSTGKAYGLQQTTSYDGRRDVVSSTSAAYDFLSALYNQFGSWELALAAYNAGPGTISKAIKRNQAAGLATDYWSLRLPKETMDYVPRFIAVAQIVKNPSEYGVYLPAIANRPHFREVQLSQPNSLNYIASTIGLDYAELHALNPGYRSDIIDYSSNMKVLIPADVSPRLDAKLGASASSTERQATVTVRNPVYNNNTSSNNSGFSTASRNEPPISASQPTLQPILVTPTLVNNSSVSNPPVNNLPTYQQPTLVSNTTTQPVLTPTPVPTPVNTVANAVTNTTAKAGAMTPNQPVVKEKASAMP
ncbi:MAG: transglycosylase SLT domain-containing protein, partial [Acinetobacter sp.]|nr:transglycosylase SLT domain-containing protein [Acinetobacter sp.]